MLRGGLGGGLEGGGNEGKLQGIYWMHMLLFILFF